MLEGWYSNKNMKFILFVVIEVQGDFFSLILCLKKPVIQLFGQPAEVHHA